MSTEIDPKLRRRDLESLDLTEACRRDIAELESIKVALDWNNEQIAQLTKKRLAIWKRRVKRGDLKKNELARISGVSSAYVAKVLE